MKRKKSGFGAVVVGADFTSRSKKVFQTARDLAEQWNAKLVLVHITQMPVLTEAELYLTPKLQKQEIENLQKKMKSFYKLSKNDTVQTIVRFGMPAEDLVRIAKKFKKPIIMVAHTKKGALGRLALGSVSKALALSSPVPVWIQ